MCGWYHKKSHFATKKNVQTKPVPLVLSLVALHGQSCLAQQPMFTWKTNDSVFVLGTVDKRNKNDYYYHSIHKHWPDLYILPLVFKSCFWAFVLSKFPVWTYHCVSVAIKDHSTYVICSLTCKHTIFGGSTYPLQASDKVWKL